MIKDLFIELFNKETNENNILSNDDVIKLTNGLFSGILGKWGNWKIKQVKKVLFGLKSGVFLKRSFDNNKQKQSSRFKL